MKKSQIYWNDWYRILFGNALPVFLVEVLLRSTFIYLLIIVCIRLMGKRMASQLSRNEVVALSALAASIGIPIQTPDRGLLPAALVAFIVVAGQRIVAGWALRNEKFNSNLKVISRCWWLTVVSNFIICCGRGLPGKKYWPSCGQRASCGWARSTACILKPVVPFLW